MRDLDGSRLTLSPTLTSRTPGAGLRHGIASWA